MPSAAITPASFTTFGALLRHLRRRARLSQRELAIAVGYSESQISRLEQNQRQPELSTLAALFVPALELDDEPQLVARLLELAAAARGDADLAGRGVIVPGTPSQVAEPIGGLEAIPLPPVHQVARGGVLARLRECLLADRGVALCGLAGMGKTTLAAALAHERARAAPVFWLTFTPGVTTSVETIVRQLALFLLAHGQDQAALLLQPAAAGRALSLDQRLALIGAGLARMAWNQVGSRSVRYGGLPLLCFDNAHLVLDDAMAAQTLHHLIATTPVAMLLTSREEVPLTGFAAVHLAGLEPDEGLQLISQLGLGLAPDLARRLLARTGGGPMLLRLAVGQLSDGRANPADVITHLEKAPQVVSYLLETTLSRLAPPARRLAALLAVFRQPIDLYDELLAAMWRETAPQHDFAPSFAGAQLGQGNEGFVAGLAELQRRHLIDHPTRAALHPLLRDHIYATLATDPWRRRRLHRLAAEWLEQSPGGAVETAYHYARADALQQAAEVLADHGETLLRDGQALAAAEVVDEALAQARRVHGTQADLLRRLLTFRGDLLAHTTRADVAEGSYREALALADRSDTRAQISRRLADTLTQRGQAEAALQICRAASATLAPDEALLLAQLAAAESRSLFTLSRYDEAVQAAERALDAAGRLAADRPRQAAEIGARAHHILGSVQLVRRRFDAALAHFRQAMSAAQQAGLVQLEHRCRVDVCALQLARGDLAGALTACEEALPQLQAAGDSYAVARLLNLAALCQQRRGELDQALATIERATALHAQIGDTQGLATAENQRASVLILSGHVAEARVAIERLLAVTPATGELREHAYFLDTLCVIELLEGNCASALVTLRRILELPAATGDDKLRGDLLNDLALALLVNGEIEEARRLIDEELPPGAGLSSELERELLRGLLALACGDSAAAAATAIDVSARAEQAGLALRSRAARRLAAAARNPPPPQIYPSLLWTPSKDTP
jgi:tetratricopeptide (TPR) repeat protein